MKVKLINGAQCPKRGRDGDAGYDLFLTQEMKHFIAQMFGGKN